MHGGQRIVVFQHGRYLGQYMLSPPPFSTLTVDGSHVVVTKMGHLENDVLDFSAGPAKEAFLDGQIEQFAR
ncbi:hypothetical protein MMA231_04269 (plasmid) [Asticcacaulis sp. MM231]